MMRNQPYDENVERSVLGVCLVDPKRIDVAMSRGLTVGAFYRRSNKNLWKAIVALHVAEKPTDSVSVLGYLRQHSENGQPDPSATYLGETMASFVEPGSFDHHVKVLLRLEQLREHAELFDTLSREAVDVPADISAWVFEAHARVDALIEEDTDGGDASLKASLVEVFDEMSKTEEDVVEAHLHMPRVDKHLGGLNPGYHLVLAGRPGMGKTTAALWAAYNEAKRGHGACINSAEQPRKEIARTFISMRAIEKAVADDNIEIIPRLTVESIRNRTCDFTALAAVANEVAGYPIKILDLASPKIEVVRGKMKQVRKEFEAIGIPLTLVVNDYMQLFTTAAGGQSREAIVSEVSRQSKAMAKELKTCVLSLAQLNRGVEQRTPPIPVLSDLRESGSIEQDADSVVFLFRPGYYAHDPRDLRCSAIIAKNRHGQTGRAELHADMQRKTFVDATDETW